MEAVYTGMKHLNVRQADEDGLSMASRLEIVFLAYFSALLPWTIQYAYDFIGDRWKTIERTKRHGWLHVSLSVPGSCYIIYYAHLQSVEPDYKEMFAAIAALMFSFLHLARTLVGLWQVKRFQSWSTDTQQCFRALGYELSHRRSAGLGQNELSRSEHSDASGFHKRSLPSPWRATIVKRLRKVSKHSGHQEDGDAEFALVNNTLIENKVSSSEGAPCRLVLNRSFGSRGATFVHRYLPFRMEPYDRAEALVRWAVAFIGQYGIRWQTESGEWTGSTWVQDCVTPAKPSELDHHKAKRNYYAGEIWATAVLHSTFHSRGCSAESDGDSELCSLLAPRMWARFRPRVDDEQEYMIRFSKETMLQTALSDGSGLPYSLPLERLCGRGSEILEPYAPVLRDATYSLPPSIRQRAKGLRMSHVDWLAILVHVGEWNTEGGQSRQAPLLSRRPESSTSSGGEFGRVNRTKTKERRLTDNLTSASVATSADPTCDHCMSAKDPTLQWTDVPVLNLRDQLGFEHGTHLDPSLCAFPIPHKCFGPFLWDSRLLLQTSAHIDNFAALVSGRQTEEVLSSAVKKLRGLDVRCFNERLETMRLERQLCGPSGKPQLHYDQTLTFLGVVAEEVRSSLTEWICRSMDGRNLEWDADVLDSPVEFHPSKQLLEVLPCEVVGGTSRDGESSRHFGGPLEMRLLWEVQNALRSKLVERLRDGSFSTSVPESVLLFLVGFPSLAVNVVPVVSKTGNPPADYIANFGIAISPVGSPQSVFVLVRGVRKSNRVALSVSFENNELNGNGRKFAWGQWRDAFQGRLQGLALWQATHRLPSMPFRASEDAFGTARILDLEDGVQIWTGWMPFRVCIAQFELKESELVVESRLTGSRYMAMASGERKASLRVSYPVEGFEPVNYAEASQASLRDAARRLDERLSNMFGPGLGSARDTSHRRRNRPPSSRPPQARPSVGLVRRDPVQAVLELDRALVNRDPTVNHAETLKSLVCLLADGAAGLDPQPTRALSILDREYAALVSRRKREEESEMTISPRRSADSSPAPETVPTDSSISRDHIIALYEYVLESTDHSAEALYATAMHFMHGQGRRPAYTIQLLECAVLYDGDVGSMAALAGVLALGNSYVRRDPPRARALWHRAIREKKHATSLNGLAKLLKDGAQGEDLDEEDCIESDPKQAVELWETAIAVHDHARSKTNLAKLLKSGASGVPRDPARSRLLWEEAAKAGDPDAMYALGLLYETGDGCDRDLRKAVKLWSRAANVAYHVGASKRLADMLVRDSVAVPRDPTRVVQLLESIIEQTGDCDIMYKLGVYLVSRNGFPYQPRRAAQLWERAIDEGDHTESMHALAILLSDANKCNGIERDTERAIELWAKPVERQHTNAMYRLALLLLGGDGNVPDDVNHARGLLKQAKDLGHVRAAAYLERLDPGGGR